MLAPPRPARAPVHDGRLLDWAEVEARQRWSALLVGNGMSIDVWPAFAYRSLYEQARRAERLSAEDLALFAALGTRNFEVVLAHLSATRRIVAALQRQTAFVEARYGSVQAAMGAAVRGVHATRSQLTGTALERVKTAMLGHEVVFTTNYDLLIYWAMGYEERYGSLVDLFWSSGSHGDCEFDRQRTRLRPGSVPVYYLHGALHLIAHGDGTTRKLRRRPQQTLLGQFERPAADDPEARPLLVTEGTSAEKLRTIKGNGYLRHALGELHKCAAPLVVFGSSLGRPDHHLAAAINRHPARPVAVSMTGREPKRERRRRQAAIRARLEAEQVWFFDAATHPLAAG